MARTLVPRFTALLDVSHMSDEDMQSVVGDVQGAAPTSTLVLANPAMAASVTALGAKSKTLTQANQTVADDRLKLHTDLALEAKARSDLQGEVRTYASFAASGAKSPADIHGAGLVSRPPLKKAKLGPTPPDTIDVRIPQKGHGKVVVSVHETGGTRRQYVAEQSLDGINWTQLGVGRGKTRTLTGASGSKVWVRFATVRGELQSEWCTPAQVSIP